jgi:hypothetical protein
VLCANLAALIPINFGRLLFYSFTSVASSVALDELRSVDLGVGFAGDQRAYIKQ